MFSSTYEIGHIALQIDYVFKNEKCYWHNFQSFILEMPTTNKCLM